MSCEVARRHACSTDRSQQPHQVEPLRLRERCKPLGCIQRFHKYGIVETCDSRMTISVLLLFGWGLPDTTMATHRIDAFAADGRVQWYLPCLRPIASQNMLMKSLLELLDIKLRRSVAGGDVDAASE